ncbi:response regulator transcription factor [Bacillus sp. FJAT-50079]|uniref:response regulator transcription factor n=1 Tax=Bacillus sp. FJAT-50079 TaxID=2833577 RepID=UPI001BCA58EC|nr:response regulator transcription factor [Bacillus sp. FJAT-50079]
MKERYKVLIVDDEALIRQGIKHYVNWEQEGFQIVGEAANGQEAMEIIQQTEPNIVLTDIVMPVIDGEELTKMIKKDYPHIQVIILSSFSDFDYVRSTFQSGVSDYILKPKLDGEELLAALKRATLSLPSIDFTKQIIEEPATIDQFIENIMSGYLFEYDDSFVRAAFPEEYFSLLHIESDNHNELNFVQVKGTLESIPFIHPVPVIQNSFAVTFLTHFHPYNHSVISQKLKEAARELNQYRWTLGEPFQDLKEIKQNYEERLLPLKGLRFYLPEKMVLFYNETPKRTSEKLFDLNRFIDVFKSEQFNKAFNYLKEHVNEVVHHYWKDENEFKAFLGNIVFNVTVLLGNLQYDNKQLDEEKYQYFTEINEANTAMEAVELLDVFLHKVNEVIEKKENDPLQSNIQKLLNYIDTHYAEPLTLTDLANHFHFNPTYLSTYFSANYRIGLNEYINEIRITKAKELLEKQNISISKISGMVGYSDHSYFCKVFKKRAGMSPSNYRKSSIT